MALGRDSREEFRAKYVDVRARRRVLEAATRLGLGVRDFGVRRSAAKIAELRTTGHPVELIQWVVDEAAFGAEWLEQLHGHYQAAEGRLLAVARREGWCSSAACAPTRENTQREAQRRGIVLRGLAPQRGWRFRAQAPGALGAPADELPGPRFPSFRRIQLRALERCELD